MWAVVRNEDIIHHTSNIIHQEGPLPSNLFSKLANNSVNNNRIAKNQ